jgi:catechol 2,3-dioxygenase-like lactoylglutathione lyase family enzyme
MATDSISGRNMLPRIGGVMTIFYYEDVAPAIAFYEHVLGFEKVLDLGWGATFRVAGQSFLTVVDSEGGCQRAIAGPNKGAILSIETDDLEAWRAKLESAGVISLEADLKSGCDGRSIEFHVRDPGDYVVEFFHWVDPPPRWRIH